MSSSKIKLSVGALVSAMVLIGGFEGYRQTAYRDAVGIPTACFGTTSGVRMGQTYAPEECAGLLVRDVIEASRVLDCVTVPLTDGQQTALTSWAYNVGVQAACRSTLVKKANAGEPPQVWCEELMRWVYAGGKKLAGLERRRSEERALCLGS